MTSNTATNPTLQRFDYPALTIRDYRHWVVLLRRDQATLGALVLAAKAEVEAWPDLKVEAFTELGCITAAIENSLQSLFSYDKINYLMLMMNDPNPHFHVIPRYAKSVSFLGKDFADPGWPKGPNLAAGATLDDDLLAALLLHLKKGWQHED